MQPPAGGRGIQLLLWTSVVLLALAGVAAWALSMVPFATFQARVNALAADGNAGTFDQAVFASLMLKVRLLGTALLAAGALVVWQRRRLARALAYAAGEVRGFLGDAWRAASRALAADPVAHRAGLAVVCLAGAAVRLRFVDQPMRYDESFTFLEYASKPLPVVLSHYSSVNNHLFHTVLVHFTTGLFGGDPWAIRIPALAAGMLMIPACYLAARLLFDREVALASAALLAGSSILVEYSTNARGYTLMGLLVLLLLAAAARLRERRSFGGWAMFVVVSALGFYTLPTMLYPFGIVVLWLVLGLPSLPAGERAGFFRDGVVASAATVGMVVVLYGPVFVVLGPRAVVGNEVVVSRGWAHFQAEIPGSLAIVWAQWNRDYPVALAAILAAGVLLSLVVHRRASRHPVPLALAIAGWVVPVFLAQRVVPTERFWLFLLPMYLILASAGVVSAVRWAAARFPARGRQTALAAAAASLAAVALSARVATSGSVYRSLETGTLRDAEPLALALRSRVREGDRVLLALPSGLPLQYYFVRHSIPGHALNPGLDPDGRAFILVDRAERQTISSVLDSTGVAPSRVTGVRPVARFATATLYEATVRGRSAQVPREAPRAGGPR